MIWSHYFEAD